MSGIFGIFNRNGKPVEEKTVNTMLDAMSYWEPDERNTWIDGSVALGHTMLWNTPESKYEHLPLKEDVYVLTMDARIDNRDELLKELELPNGPLEEIGDSEFILSAYKKWGEECPKYLLGDFSFAIWDEKKQQLFCARDHIGIKSFYYYLDDEKFVFSNEIKVLLSHIDIKNILNDDGVAYYLNYGLLSDLDMTFYKNIYKLHSATSMTIIKDKERVDTYWKAEQCPKVFYNSLDEYVHRAKELLEESVNVRVRSIYPISSHLSGGLDSSSIAVLASRKLRKNGNSLIGFNWIPVLDDDEETDYFEWGNSKKIALLENIEHQAIDLSEGDILELYKTVDITNGDTIAFWYEQQIQKYAKKKNIRVVLSGTGGDEFISNNSYGLIAGFFWRGEFKRAYRALQLEGLESRYQRIGFIKRFYSHIILPSIPNWFYCMYSGTYCSFNKVSKYITPTMKKSIKKLRTNKKLLQSIGLRNNMLNALHDGSIQVRTEAWNVSGRSNKIEYRYPLLDKRIVEFSLGIPEEIFRQNGNGRFLFRHVIKGLLPQKIIWSDTKYEPKRVEQYVSISQKAQSEWKKSYVTEDNNKYIKISALFREMDKYSINNSISEKNYDIILLITNMILILENRKEE